MRPPRLQNLIDQSLAAGLKHYDREFGLSGDYDQDFFLPETLAVHFNQPFSARALHPFRDSLSLALLLFAEGREPDIAERILSEFCRNAPTPDGRLKWFLEEKHVRDNNGTFFSTEPLLLIEHCFGSRLPAELHARTVEILKKTLPVFQLEREKNSLSYVNPTLAAFTFSALLSEKFAPEQQPEAVAAFRKYIGWLTENGMPENYTVTYMTVDMLMLLCVLIVSSDAEFRQTASDFLKNMIFRQFAFFGSRYPAPFRRGYNGHYETERKGLLPYLLNWRDSFELSEKDPPMIFTAIFALASDQLDFLLPPETGYPRELTQKIHEDCIGQSYLDEKYLIGAFDRYPSRDNIVWQCVTSGGSGWQDGPVYATFENQSRSSLILRLEAVDAQGNFNCHPYEGDFCMAKTVRICPWRSFPPAPKIRTLLRKNDLLCLFKIDLIDAELQKLGFNLHFSRFSGELLDLKGEDVPDGIHEGPAAVFLEDICIALFPLRRVRMKGATLARSAGFIEPSFTVRSKPDTLDLQMYNLDETAPGLYTQNHVSGGFFLHIETGTGKEEFLRRMRGTEISDELRRNRINAAIDERDAVRTVKVNCCGEELQLVWDHYAP